MTSLQIVQNRLKRDCGGWRTLPGCSHGTVPLPLCPQVACPPHGPRGGQGCPPRQEKEQAARHPEDFFGGGSGAGSPPAPY